MIWRLTVSRNKGGGRLSYRGITALGIGLVFMWFAMNPEYFNDDRPPFLILVIMFVSGAGLAFGGIISLRFVWVRSSLVRGEPPVAAEICVLQDDDSDRGTETVHVRVGGRCQALDVDRSGAVHKYVDGTVRWGEVWLDTNGRVHAIALEGEYFNTLIGGRELRPDAFGKKE